jgi:hypothetical protein
VPVASAGARGAGSSAEGAETLRLELAASHRPEATVGDQREEDRGEVPVRQLRALLGELQSEARATRVQVVIRVSR